MEKVNNDGDYRPFIQLSRRCTMIDDNDDEFHNFLKRKYTVEDIAYVERKFRDQNNGNNPVTVQEFEEFRENLKGIAELERENEQMKRQHAMEKTQLEEQIYQKNSEIRNLKLQAHDRR